MDSTIVIIGQGSALDSRDYASLSNVDTLGFDKAYRHWDAVEWYPTHYCCFNPDLVLEHGQEIKRLVDDGRVQTACLHRRFLDCFPESADDSRYHFVEQALLQDGKDDADEHQHKHSIFSGVQSEVAIAECNSLRYAISLGYERIGLLKVNVIDDGLTSSDSDRKMGEGDTGVPVFPADRSARIIAAFNQLKNDLIVQERDVEVVNCSLDSELHARGVFPFIDLDDFVGRQKLDALAIITQKRERNQILNNLRLWQTPECAPFLHFRGREKLKLVFTFTGHEDENLKAEILDEYDASERLQRWFHRPEFYFFLLPEGEDVYIRVGSPVIVGKKGYKSGPNQQFFRSIFALSEVCRYAYFMETDCLPIRPDWLGQLCDIAQSSEAFWVMGSHYRGKLRLASQLARHINGSAIYAVGNRDFLEFAREWQRILDEVVEHQDRAMAYDCVIEYFLSREFNTEKASAILAPESRGWKLFQKAASYLRYTESILNYSGKPDLESADDSLLQSIREYYGAAYVVHNKTLCEQAYCRVLGFDREQDPVKGSVSGCFTRSQHAYINETALLAELLSGRYPSSVSVPISVSVGRDIRHDSSLFSRYGWKTYRFVPVPDSHQQPPSTGQSAAVGTEGEENETSRGLAAGVALNGSASLSLKLQDGEVDREAIAADRLYEVYGLNHINALSIDADALSLDILQAISGAADRPDVVQCLFDEATPSVCGFNDLIRWCIERDYAVLVSEWHPKDCDGTQRDWYRLATYPCELADSAAWGSVLAFKQPPNLAEVAAIAGRLVDTSSAAEEAQERSSPPIRQGAQSTDINGAARQEKTISRAEMTPQTTAVTPASHQRWAGVAALATPAGQPTSPAVPNRGSYLLKRIVEYYRRWPVVVAAAIVVCTGLSTIETLPYRRAFTVAETLMTLFLVGHAATRSDRIIDNAQRQADDALELARRSNSRASSIGDRAREQVKTLQRRIDDVASQLFRAEEQARYASSTATDSLKASNRLVHKTNLLEASFAATSEESRRALAMSTDATRVAEQATDTAEQARDAADQMAEAARDATETMHLLVNQFGKLNSTNVSLFQPLGRQLSDEHLETLLNFWLPALNLDLTPTSLGYLAHQICLLEDACSGRLTTTLEDMLLRVLVALSIRQDHLSVLEIGSMFGVGLGILHDVCRGHFESIHLMAIDPLDSQPVKNDLDAITQVPVTAKTFEHNMRRLDIPFRDVTLISGLSDEKSVLIKAGQRQYNLLVLDGDRSYDGVKFDFDHYLPALNLGGYVMFDDYGSAQWPDVKLFVDSEVKSNPSLKFIGSSWKTAVFKVANRNLL